MNSLELNQQLAPVYQALNNIKVCGKDDLNNLLGAIMVIEGILKDTVDEVQREQNSSNSQNA